MNGNRRAFLTYLAVGAAGVAGLIGDETHAGPPAGRGRGGGGRGRGGPPGGRGRGNNDQQFQADRSLFQTLLSNHKQIRRNVKMLPNGVETLTETDNPQLQKVLVQHVWSMKKRVEDVRPIHMRDPLFAAMFRNAKKVSMMKVTPTKKGVHVIETSDDPFTVKLIQAHAKVVSLFIKKGHLEARKNHPVPN